MKNLLLLFSITIGLVTNHNYIVNSNNINPKAPSITENMFDYDTGTFYQTTPLDIVKPYNDFFIDNSSRNNEFGNREIPTDPFEGDTFVPNASFLSTYYSHLSANMPMNRLGVCGYTGIAMLLSYYDTYWNDNFIPEQYESNPTQILENDLYSSNVAAYESPGVYNNVDWTFPTVDDLKDEIIALGIDDEESEEFKAALENKIMEQINCQINAGTFLGRLFQIALANGSIVPHGTNNSGYLNGIGVVNHAMTSVLQDYIDLNQHLCGNVSIVTSKMNDSSLEEKQRIRSEIVNIVRQGRPVLLGGESFVDLNGNGEVDNGEISTGHIVVAYEYDVNNDILYGNMGWSHPTQSHINLNTHFNRWLSDYWALNISSGLSMSRTNNYIFTDKTAYYSPGPDVTFNTIKPSDYGFTQAYGDGSNETTKVVNLSSTNESFTIKRLRCAYIYGECINLSTRRYSPGLAYLEYTFNKDIRNIEIDLSWWSDNELVYPYNSNYRIEYLLSSNIYFEALDLWDDVTLSTDRDNPTKIWINLALSNIRTFRIYGLSSNPVYSQNKGRLSIFDLTVEYED